MGGPRDIMNMFQQELTASKRPLSVRRLMKICQEKGWASDEWTLTEVTALLRDFEAVVEIRKGVFTTALQNEAHVRTQKESRAPSDALNQVHQSEVGVFPESMDEAVTLRKNLGDRAALRNHLRAKLKAHLSSESRSGLVQEVHTQEPKSVSPILSKAGEVRAKTATDVYVERRHKQVDVAGDMRASKEEPNGLSELGRLIHEMLEVTGRPMTFEELQQRIGKSDIPVDISRVRMTVFVENERCRHQGLREPFVVNEGEGVGLSSWGLPSRFIELENQVNEARREHAELVKRALLQRLSELSDDGFRQAISLMLERNGIQHIDLLASDNEGGFVLLADQRRGTTEEKVVILVSKAWSQVDADTVKLLQSRATELGVGGGILISMGTFTNVAVSQTEARHGANIQLIDGELLANLFYQARVGLRSSTWTFCYPDLSFFKGLTDS